MNHRPFLTILAILGTIAAPALVGASHVPIGGAYAEFFDTCIESWTRHNAPPGDAYCSSDAVSGQSIYTRAAHVRSPSINAFDREKPYEIDFWFKYDPGHVFTFVMRFGEIALVLSDGKGTATGPGLYAYAGYVGGGTLTHVPGATAGAWTHARVVAFPVQDRVEVLVDGQVDPARAATDPGFSDFILIGDTKKDGKDAGLWVDEVMIRQPTDWPTYQIIEGSVPRGHPTASIGVAYFTGWNGWDGTWVALESPSDGNAVATLRSRTTDDVDVRFTDSNGRYLSSACGARGDEACIVPAGASEALVTARSGTNVGFELLYEHRMR